MNRLSTEKRATILRCLVDRMSIRATSRITGTAINSVVKLLVDAVHNLLRLPIRAPSQPALHSAGSRRGVVVFLRQEEERSGRQEPTGTCRRCVDLDRDMRRHEAPPRVADWRPFKRYRNPLYAGLGEPDEPPDTTHVRRAQSVPLGCGAGVRAGSRIRDAW